MEKYLLEQLDSDLVSYMLENKEIDPYAYGIAYKALTSKKYIMELTFNEFWAINRATGHKMVKSNTMLNIFNSFNL